MAETKQTREKENIQKTNLRRRNDKKQRHRRETTRARRRGMTFPSFFTFTPHLFSLFPLTFFVKLQRQCPRCFNSFLFAEFENNGKKYTQCNTCRVVRRRRIQMRFPNSPFFETNSPSLVKKNEISFQSFWDRVRRKDMDAPAVSRKD